MTKALHDRGSYDSNAPSAPAADDPTERHLVKARELLREARSRLTARDGEPAEAKPDPPSSDGDSE
jgi:hypothetical protein